MSSTTTQPNPASLGIWLVTWSVGHNGPQQWRAQTNAEVGPPATPDPMKPGLDRRGLILPETEIGRRLLAKGWRNVLAHFKGGPRNEVLKFDPAGETIGRWGDRTWRMDYDNAVQEGHQPAEPA